MMLKRWHLSFDLVIECFNFIHLWVILPGLPLQMWNSKYPEAIGNSIGHFIKFDEGALRSLDKIMAKVLVEVDIHLGLLEVLEIK